MRNAVLIMLFTDMLCGSLERVDVVYKCADVVGCSAVTEVQHSGLKCWAIYWMYSGFSCTSKLAFPISISLSPCPALNQQLTTAPLQ